MLRAEVQVRRGSFVLEASLQVARGEVVAVMGANGSGKSTLLGALAGTIPLAGGSVELEGRMLSQAGQHVVPIARRGIGMLWQESLLFPHLSALKNIEFGAHRSGRASRGVASTGSATEGRALTEPVEVGTRPSLGDRRTRRPSALALRRSPEMGFASSSSAQHWLAALDLTGLEHRKPRELSGGQQRRVAIARALAADPRVLLLDEPLASVDAASAPAIRTLLREALADRSGVLVTHDVADALALADRVILLESGRVVRSGPTREVLATLGAGLSVEGEVGADGSIRLPEGIRLDPGSRITVTVT